ncbi:hypothetical protein I4U23_013996 [Adineta vaga]|nr:hypothetical protein I4U23_013996 [Adineta vaga]
MDDFIDEENNLRNNEFITSESNDEQDDVDTNDVLVGDPEEDQDFPEDLNREVEQADQIFPEPDIPVVFQDDEKESSDSGMDDDDSVSDTSAEVIASMSPSISPVVIDRGRGRGRLGSIAVDDAGKPLPPPRIRDVKAEDGFYPKPGKLARLPISYYRKRQDPSELNAHLVPRRETSLIDFQTTFNRISFIVDANDKENKAYLHACKRLRGLLPDDKLLDLPVPQFENWSFGLFICHINLPEKVSLDVLKLIPEKVDNETNRPFWFLFKRLLTFKNWPSPPKPTNDKDMTGKYFLVERSVYADLSYGALTTMNRFHSHPDYFFRKRTKWSIVFNEERFEIYTNAINQAYDQSELEVTQIKYKVPAAIIDRAAVICLLADGFDLFLNMKGNVHELKRTHLRGTFSDQPSDQSSKPYQPFVRQGIHDNKLMPSFSTIRIRLRLKDDVLLTEYLERVGKIERTTSLDQKENLLKEIRDAGLLQIQNIFQKFLEFFDKNRVHVSFGRILARKAPVQQLVGHNNHSFPTFIQNYCWAMLCNIGFRIEVQLYICKLVITKLKEYSKSYDCFEKETVEDIDDRFYRLCLYLHRRSSEYFFLNLDQEIEIGIGEYKKKYDRAKAMHHQMAKFNQGDALTAYTPSIVITPTTVRIRPLKLCKLNRVLREKKFGNILNFALVELRDEAQRMLFPNEYRALRDQTLKYLTDGFDLTPNRTYKYLHHSQSQVKAKQFWFYYHDKANQCLSHEDAYIWMGNFDKERVVAKHSARIALCFTSSDATIRIPAETVKYVRDIKDETGEYTFSDGVGKISADLRDQVKTFLEKSDNRNRRSFSVLQIRYGGCKGTLSVVPELNGQKYQMIIRDSMNKFTSDHDTLEICKLSAPRTLYLNRQDVILLESRDIPHTNFLTFQNENHFWLIQALLIPSTSFELLQDKLLPVFKLRKIIRNINIIEEHFFIKLIITCAFNIIRELLDRTRVHISHKYARNMFGIVDEYGVLEEGEVFIQYTKLHDQKLYQPMEIGNNPAEREVLLGNVVITKNPCHHPGDLRVFNAVNRKELRHLVDCVVFPQKGRRPHPNEISGSDLDGDEYVVIWHEDLIPKTENEEAYKYDSQGDPPKMDRPITREDINRGSLSNIHLAYSDKCGIKSEKCKEIAGWISEEVDAAKTGKHPLTETEMAQLKKDFGEEWPDFMKVRGPRKYYTSQRILGKLYRSATRAIDGWTGAIRQYGNARYQALANDLTIDSESQNPTGNEKISESDVLSQLYLSLDRDIYHDDWKKYLTNIKALYNDYRYDLLEIINLYRFQDEIDLLCRCDSMDASAGGKKGGLEDSASIEVKNLVARITRQFFAEFDRRREEKKCCSIEYDKVKKRQKFISCDVCRSDKQAKAACAYIYSYRISSRLPTNSNRRILSFPWLFGGFLIRLKHKNQSKDSNNQINFIIAKAFSTYTKKLVPKFKVFVQENSIGTNSVTIHYRKRQESRRTLVKGNTNSNENSREVSLLRICFIEILNDWLIKQAIFGNDCKETARKPSVPESIWHELIVEFLTDDYQPNFYPSPLLNDQEFITEPYLNIIKKFSLEWTNNHKYQVEFHEMFREIHSRAIEHAKTTELTVWAYLDEYIISALQCIGIEKCLLDKWIK